LTRLSSPGAAFDTPSARADSLVVVTEQWRRGRPEFVPGGGGQPEAVTARGNAGSPAGSRRAVVPPEPASALVAALRPERDPGRPPPV